MKIIRYFIQGEDDQTGDNGWFPLWIPKSAEFNAILNARGLVHDALEHRLTDSGHFHEEAMAFGRFIALRSIPNVGNTSGRNGRQAESLAIELCSIWGKTEQARFGEQALVPPRTARLENRIEEWIAPVEETFVSELCDYSEPDARKIALSVQGWIRIGYRDALRRYGQQDHGCHDNGHAAFKWAEKNERHIEVLIDNCHPEAVLRLCWDTQQLQMTQKLIEPSPENDMHQLWLRNRIWAWKNNRPSQLPADYGCSYQN